MKVIANIDGKQTLVKVINNNYNNHAKEVKILEGSHTGIYTIVENKDIEPVKVKFTAKVCYDTTRSEEFDGSKWVNKITGRFFNITITSDSITSCNDLLDSLESCINSEYNNLYFARCGEVEVTKNGKYELCDTIEVDNKEEYEELVKIYKQWKINNK